MIAGNDDYLPSAAEPCANRSQHGLRNAHRLSPTSLQQLNDISKQDESVDAIERAQQRVKRLRVVQNAALQAGTEMKI